MNMTSDNPYVVMMQGWLAVSSDNMQLAVASLVLPVVFLRQVLGVPEGETLSSRLNGWLYASWLILLVSIGFWMFYQTIATCRIGERLGNGDGLACRIGDPNIVFSLAAASLVAGVVSFVVGALISVRK